MVSVAILCQGAPTVLMFTVISCQSLKNNHKIVFLVLKTNLIVKFFHKRCLNYNENLMKFLSVCQLACLQEFQINSKLLL